MMSKHLPKSLGTLTMRLANLISPPLDHDQAPTAAVLPLLLSSSALPHQSQCSRGKFCTNRRTPALNGIRWVTDTTLLGNSGVARTLRSSAFARPTTVRRAFQPITTNLAPALSSRFASSDSARDGKIHQVIGAVVDGMRKF